MYVYFFVEICKWVFNFPPLQMHFSVLLYTRNKKKPHSRNWNGLHGILIVFNYWSILLGGSILSSRYMSIRTINSYIFIFQMCWQASTTSEPNASESPEKRRRSCASWIPTWPSVQGSVFHSQSPLPPTARYLYVMLIYVRDFFRRFFGTVC